MADELTDDELKATMGSYFKTASRIPGDGFQPGKAPQPKSPSIQKQGGTGEGILPPFPIVPPNQVSEYKQEKQTDKDTFGLEQSGKFDPELNEIALREVAQERGMTVEQLLKSQADRRSEVKLDIANYSGDKKLPSSFEEAPKEEPKKSSPIDTELVKKMQVKSNKKKMEKKLEQEKPGVPREMYDNPVIEKLRKKLSIEATKPAKIEVEGITFEMLPPTSSLNLWILEKIQAGQILAGDGLPLQLTIKLATVSAAVSKIEGEDIVKVLQVEEGDDLGRKILAAQTLWEMFIGLPSRKEMFSFHPDVALKLYEAYKKAFGEKDLKTDLQDDVHRYICNAEGCLELYDMREPASGVMPFCKVHGTPMEDKGLIQDLRAIPLA